MHIRSTVFTVVCCIGLSSTCFAQSLETRLQNEPIDALAKAVVESGDAKRGALVFHRVTVGCAKCHSVKKPTEARQASSLGPNLALLGAQKIVTNASVIESILTPSKSIRKGYETITVIRTDGTVATGLKVQQRDDGTVLLREAGRNEVLTIPASEIEEAAPSKLSIMPAGVVNTLASRQQFLDLAKYVFEIRDGGFTRAQELQPAASLIAFKIPEYEKNIDHAGLIRDLDEKAFERGEAIYNRLCINCHGNLERAGSLPTALRFWQGKFRNGSDPYAMYQTLTHGFGLMVPQTWMVPKQKYDAIHYIRETFLKPHNPTQYFATTKDYLDALPAGKSYGPEPTEFSPWSDMDYGPWMHNTLEVSRDGSNIAYKGLAVRLDPGPGGVARGNRWMLFDHDTMRIASGWSHKPGNKSRFIDWQGIHFDGRHQAHPHVVGHVLFENPTGPGWANPATGSFEDNQRVIGRDGNKYGPLPKSWAEYHGMYHAGTTPIVSYSIGGAGVLESWSSIASGSGTSEPLFVRTLHLQPTTSPRTLLVATINDPKRKIQNIGDRAVRWGGTQEDDKPTEVDSPVKQGVFDGSAWLQVGDTKNLNMATHDFTVTARIKTKSDGVIFSNTTPGSKWVPNGCALFIRNGRLCYDVGWVGVVESKKRVANNRWHKVAVTWSARTGDTRLYMDGEQVGRGKLTPEKRLDKSVARIGFGAPNFPRQSAFNGAIRDIEFHSSVLDANLLDIETHPHSSKSLVGRWLSQESDQKQVGPKARIVKNAQSELGDSHQLLTGFTGDAANCQIIQQGNRLCLNLPASSKPRTVAIWLTHPTEADSGGALLCQVTKAHKRVEQTMEGPTLAERIRQPATNLWPESLTTLAAVGEKNSNGFAVDTLTAPNPNPWLARLRFSGLDFYDDGDRMAVCTWDGDVFEVAGLSNLSSKSGQSRTNVPTGELKWKRIASGLFQPLGLKIVDGDIYLTCRDQIIVLRDRNGDGATDFFECFNNDHQVTEHFHEFAMGLQRDAGGNFYYAKSARHAKTALVPHHGTLLKVTPDGSRTEILAVGFRAANGVCLNPDGSFVVTDQEGHWNPKNRINWVTEGGFYGNMYGYHNVTNEADSAMRQPLCWITNSFDRSPAELLWTKPNQWGNLNNTLLNLSYGYGKIFTVPHEKLAGTGRVQGAMCELPIPQFPTGTMRGRFRPQDGQLYTCGLFAWGSSRQMSEGGLYRIRYAGQGAMMPVATHATRHGLEITFSDRIDKAATTNLGRYQVKVWDLKRTKNYGSKHYNERSLTVTQASLKRDGKTLVLDIKGLRPTWCYELRCSIQPEKGDEVSRTLHGTNHELK